MKQKMIALAGGLGLALPMATPAVTLYEDDRSEVVLEGELHISAGTLDGVDVDDSVVSSDDDSSFNLHSHQSEIAIGGSREIAPGVDGIFALATNVAGTGEAGVDGFFGSRDTYIGVQANAGMLRVGIIDTAFEDADDELEDANSGNSAFAIDPRPDGISDWKAIIHGLPEGGAGGAGGGTDDVFDVRAADTIEYTSPRLGGVANFRIGYHGNSIEGSANDPDESDAPDNNDVSGMSASASFALGDFGVTYAFERQNWDGSAGNVWGGVQAASVDAPTAHNIIVQWGTDAGFNVGAAFETLDMDAVDGSGNSGFERDAYYLMASQQFGGDKAYAKFAQADDMDIREETGASFVALGYQRQLNAEMQVYVEAAQTSNDDNATYAFDGGGTGVGVSAAGEDVSGLSVGAVYAF